jgi:predicted kinase
VTAGPEFTPSAAARQVLDALPGGAPAIAAADLWRALAGRPGNLGLALLDALPAADRQAPAASLPVAVLAEHARQEAQRAGSEVAGCEHLVLGALRYAESAGAVAPGTTRRARLARIDAIAGRAGRALLALEPGPGTRIPRAVLITGWPGSGKSTLADAVAARLDADLFALDWQLGALAPFGLIRGDNGLALAGHLQDTALAHHLLRRRDLVMDVIGASATTRARWFEIAARLDGALFAVECVCPDESVLRERVTARRRAIPGWPDTVTWDHVQRTREAWEPWEQDRLVVDTLEPVGDCVQRVLAYVEQARGPGIPGPGPAG